VAKSHLWLFCTFIQKAASAPSYCSRRKAVTTFMTRLPLMS
jgi:hypothetical protein